MVLRPLFKRKIFIGQKKLAVRRRPVPERGSLANDDVGEMGTTTQPKRNNPWGRRNTEEA
jgi:hypothetical protein